MLSLMETMVKSFGSFYLTVAPTATKAFTALLSVVGGLLNDITKLGPAATDMVAAFLLSSKLLGLGTTLKGIGAGFAFLTSATGKSTAATAQNTAATAENTASKTANAAANTADAGAETAQGDAAAGVAAKTTEDDLAGGGFMSKFNPKTWYGNLTGGMQARFQKWGASAPTEASTGLSAEQAAMVNSSGILDEEVTAGGALTAEQAAKLQAAFSAKQLTAEEAERLTAHPAFGNYAEGDVLSEEDAAKFKLMPVAAETEGSMGGAAMLAGVGGAAMMGGMGILGGGMAQHVLGLRSGTKATVGFGAAGAGIGAALGLAGGPFAALSVPVGSAIGGAIGGALGPSIGHALGSIFGSASAKHYGVEFAQGIGEQFKGTLPSGGSCWEGGV